MPVPRIGFPVPALAAGVRPGSAPAGSPCHPYHYVETFVPLFKIAMTGPSSFPSIDTMKRQADLTKRRAVDLCRVSACLCRMR
jgi:hypothetical protein